VPDASALELIARELRAAHGSADAAHGSPVVETVHFRDRATLTVEPEHIRDVLARMRARGYTFLASVHGVDYFPDEPRFGVVYELLDMDRVDRITVKVRVAGDVAEVDSVTPEWPTANHQEREAYDLFGVRFRDHPDLRRILMPEDYEGHPLRRDFPLGGEPVRFTFNEHDRVGPDA
jgi:NADH-quinone oxidoreductase subunit C